MSVKFLLGLGFSLLSLSLNAQEAAMTPTATRSLSPADKWEIGIGLGMPLVIGDFDAKLAGFGVNGHIRKSLDHVWSLRGVAFYGKAANEATGSGDTRKSDLTYMSGSIQGVMTLNNLRFNKPVRKLNLNIFGGVGLNSLSTEYSGLYSAGNSVFPFQTSGKISNDDVSLQGQSEIGGELLYRISPKFNLGFSHTIIIPFGKNSDILDSDDNHLYNQRTSYRDLLHFPHLSLNFNLGKAGKSEPLYWVNPMGGVMDAIANLEARPVYDPTDTDGDGVIDAIDQEDNSPTGARVDSRGVTLDSDSDGLPDFKDKEPFSPPGFKIDAMGVAQIPKEPTLSEGDVNRIVDAKLAGFKPNVRGLADWFLPMINFDLDRYNVKQSEYAKLHNVASVLQKNPDIRVVVTGYADRTSGNTYNNVLSYNRAMAAINFLTAKYGISRDRLVLNYGGEETVLVDTNAQNYLNRRVEFKVASKETEMSRPEGKNAGKGPRFNSNTGGGY
jgi:outer membrane protein OmpA-like peptidoglycan-associated protein